MTAQRDLAKHRHLQINRKHSGLVCVGLVAFRELIAQENSSECHLDFATIQEFAVGMTSQKRQWWWLEIGMHAGGKPKRAPNVRDAPSEVDMGDL